jgi:uncharacterized membrane protein HdeD (DUF308 family)
MVLVPQVKIKAQNRAGLSTFSMFFAILIGIVLALTKTVSHQKILTHATIYLVIYGIAFIATSQKNKRAELLLPLSAYTALFILTSI